MKHSRKGWAFLVAAGVFSAQAAQLDLTVPVELARALAGGGTLYRGLPPDFPAFDLPQGLRVMGAHDRPGQQRVLLRSAPAGDEAQRAIVQALLPQGWIELPAPRQARRQTGFIIPDLGTPRPVMLCHDDFGLLEVRGESGVENRVYLQRYAYAPPARLPDCQLRRQDLLAQGPTGRPPADPLPSPIPALAPPEPSALGSTVPAMAVIRDAAIGSGSFQTDDRIVAEGFSPGELLAHYAGQMREQEWEAEAEWAGEYGAGGNWTRVANGDSLMTSLLIAREDEAAFFVKLIVRNLE